MFPSSKDKFSRKENPQYGQSSKIKYQSKNRENNKDKSFCKQQREDHSLSKYFKPNGEICMEAFFGNTNRFRENTEAQSQSLKASGFYPGTKQIRGGKRLTQEPIIQKEKLEDQMQNLQREKDNLVQKISAQPPPCWQDSTIMWQRIDSIERQLLLISSDKRMPVEKRTRKEMEFSFKPDSPHTEEKKIRHVYLPGDWSSGFHTNP